MPKLETIYLIHHSHTDVGYTHDQPIVWDLQTRFIDEALRMAEKYAEQDSDGALRWTVETTSVLKRWLQNATDQEIERFRAMEKAGRIEVTAMFANLTPLLDTDQFIETFQFIDTLRNVYGFRVEHAMNCDVNGQNWPLVDLLLDLGIKGFTMAINTHFGGAVQPRPLPFLWQGPSGRKLPVNNGWPYDKGWREGIGRDAEDLEHVRLPRLQAYLDDIGYPLPILLLQSFHPYGDNGSVFDFTPFIDFWNASGKSPRIVLATPRMWWAAVQKYTDSLQTLRGDWTDYWNFGSISTAREQTINRASRVRLRHADAIYATLRAVTQTTTWAATSFERHREKAWESLTLWDEHTWGADIAILDPQSEDTASQWHHKAHYAYTTRSLSLLLQRDALADFAQQVGSVTSDDLLVFNSLPWARKVTGDVPFFVLNPRGVPEDTTAGRHHQDRSSVVNNDFWGDQDRFVLPPTELPPLGYKVIKRDDLAKPTFKASSDATVENHRYHVTFNRDTGGIMSIYDKSLDWELVDHMSSIPMNGFVHECVADENATWPRQRLFHQEWHADLAEIPPGWQRGWHAKRSGPTRVIKHEVQRRIDGLMVVQTLEAPGVAGDLIQRTFLPNYADYIEFSAVFNMSLNTHPEATYLAFPFNVPEATTRYDLGPQSVVAGEEQLPGVCRDYFTVQGWVDFSNGERGVTVATPDNPLVQFGGFHFGDFQREFKLERATLLGWIANNYWETNFRAHQPGRVSARYRMLPHDGEFDENRAHRFGLEAMAAQPILQHMGEPKANSAALPQEGTLLELPVAPIETLHMLHSPEHDGILLRLINASDNQQTAQILSGLLKIAAAHQCDLFGQPVEALPVKAGVVTLEVPARRVAILLLKTH